jgi:AbrB family looped-hinge helix DNA binding protein
MNATTTIDKAGRLVVPKQMRDSLHLKAGDELEIESSEEGLYLKPKVKPAVMKKKDGIWVIESGGRITNEMVNETLRQVREEREQRILGE